LGVDEQHHQYLQYLCLHAAAGEQMQVKEQQAKKICGRGWVGAAGVHPNFPASHGPLVQRTYVLCCGLLYENILGFW
jgi:hypothetical protein